MNRPYRPWGPFDWVLGKLSKPRWSLLGSFNTEDRCEAVLAAFPTGVQASTLFLKVLDPDTPITEPFELRYAEMGARLVAAGCAARDFRDVPLLASLDAIIGIANGFLASGA